MNSPQNKDPAAGSAVSTGPSLPVRILKIVLSFSFLFLSLEAGSVRGNLVSAALGEGDSVISFGYLITGLVRSILGLLFFLLLGGKKWLHYIKGSIAHAWKFALPLIIFHTVVGGLVIESLFVPKSLGGSGGEIAAYALEHIVLSVAIMLLVGINEEVIFRGLGLGGMLLVFGHKKNGALWSVLLMSLIFGFVHVIYEIDITDPITIFIGLLKTLQTAMIGIILSCCIMTDQTLLGAMTVHAFCDWIIMVGELLIKQDVEADYVVTESPTPLLTDTLLIVAEVVIFIVIMLIYLPRTIKAIKILRAMPPTSGPFAAPAALPPASDAE